MKLITLALFLFSSLAFARSDISPFTSDGCSSWHEGPIWDVDQWELCCFEHDISYWMGGTRAERKAADSELLSCVADKAHLLEGWVMYSGVRLGGRPFYPTPYRWGYGWNYTRNYGPLSSQEKRLVLEELIRSRFDGEENKIIQNYLKKFRSSL